MALSCRSVLPRSLGGDERDAVALLGSCGPAAKGSGGLSSALGARERRERAEVATTSSPLARSHAYQDKYVDVADKYVAIVANKGFAVYVLSLKDQDEDKVSDANGRKEQAEPDRSPPSPPPLSRPPRPLMMTDAVLLVPPR